MACWMIANESTARRKIALARRYGVPTVTGGGPFEIAVMQGELPAYLDLCADIGVTRIECGQGFTESEFNPRKIVAAARSRGLDVQMELGKKHDGGFNERTLGEWIDSGQEWLDAGAVQLRHRRAERVLDMVGGVAVRGGEEAQRVIAPVVLQPVLQQMRFVDE